MRSCARPTLRSPDASDAAALGAVLYRSFAAVAAEFSYRSTFPDEESGKREATRLLRSARHFGLVATDRGEVLGAAFAAHGSEVVGVGPIVVDPRFQGRGVGRVLMTGLMGEIERRGYERARLQHDAPNVRSMTLYATVGFDYVDTAVILEAPPRLSADVRRAEERDIDAAVDLCAAIYRVDRRTEIEDAATENRLLVFGTPMSGYLIPTVFGHGVATDPEAAIDLARHIAWEAGSAARFLTFLRHADFYRAAIAAGCRPVKVMNTMAWGGYVAPGHLALPSISF